jgi:hypothetical protein
LPLGGSPYTSISSGPSLSTTTTTPSPTLSVQHYRTQFIKEGLKMKVQQKLGSKKEEDYFIKVRIII